MRVRRRDASPSAELGMTLSTGRRAAAFSRVGTPWPTSGLRGCRHSTAVATACTPDIGRRHSRASVPLTDVRAAGLPPPDLLSALGEYSINLFQKRR